MVREVPAPVAAEWLREGHRILDVRESFELQLAAVEGVVHIPMGQLPERLGELQPDARLAVLCHHGVRSWQVAAWLQHNGFTDVWNITGGIDAWADHDPSVGRY